MQTSMLFMALLIAAVAVGVSASPSSNILPPYIARSNSRGVASSSSSSYKSDAQRVMDAASPGSLRLSPCKPPNPTLAWDINELGQLVATSTGLCATAGTLNGVPAAGARLFLSACRAAAAPQQSWARTEHNQIASTAYQSLCICTSSNSVGSALSLAKCEVTAACQWAFAGPGKAQLSSSGEPGQCMTTPYIAPLTCDRGSPSRLLPFCDSKQPIAVRLSDLSQRLNVSDKVDLVAHAATPTAFIDSLNVKSFFWDTTCVHGVASLYTYFNQPPASTVLPMPLALAASFDEQLLFNTAKMTADEARVVSSIQYTASGGTETWGLVCNGGPLGNIARDPRWGRLSETYGEDPFWASVAAVHATQGLQRSNSSTEYLETAAVARHMAAFSGPVDEMNFSVTVDNRTMHDTYLPALEAIMTQGGAEGVMAAYSAINGVPSAASTWLLQSLLRNSWGSDAYVIGDWGAVEGIYTQHHYSTSAVDAVVDAVTAGVQNIYNTKGKEGPVLQQALSQKLLSQKQLDNMVMRLLTTRFRLGEFDGDDNNPYATVSPDVLDSSTHRQLARSAASASVVLLKNEDHVLPFTTKLKSIAVIGPNARDHSVGYGNNVYSHSYAGFQPNIVDIASGITDVAALNNVQVSVVQGCKVNETASPYCFCCEPTAPDFIDAIAAAKLADVAVIVVGTTAHFEAENVDRTTLRLPGLQEELVAAVTAAGTPVVLVLVNGGPLALGPPPASRSSKVPLPAAAQTAFAAGPAASAHSIVEAWFGGEEAGNGLADVLFGVVVPAGRMPVTAPASVEQLPAFTDYSMTAGNGRTYRYLDTKTAPPEFMFGYGLSYTQFMYSDLSLHPSQVGPSEKVYVSVNVTNTGTLDAQEVAQLYVQVPSQGATLPTPRLALQGVQKYLITAQRSRIVTFELTPYQFSTVQTNGTRTVSEGTYKVYVGGHQPNDTLGAAASNVVQGEFVVKGKR